MCHNMGNKMIKLKEYTTNVYPAFGDSVMGTIGDASFIGPEGQRKGAAKKPIYKTPKSSIHYKKGKFAIDPDFDEKDNYDQEKSSKSYGDDRYFPKNSIHNPKNKIKGEQLGIPITSSGMIDGGPRKKIKLKKMRIPLPKQIGKIQNTNKKAYDRNKEKRKTFNESDELNNNTNEILLQTIASDLRSFRPGGYSMKGEVQIENDRVSIDFRDLGNWIDDEEDGQQDYEDNDWKVWADGQYEKYNKIFKTWASNKPWYNKVKLDLSTSEKSWCEFNVIIGSGGNDENEKAENRAEKKKIIRTIMNDLNSFTIPLTKKSDAMYFYIPKPGIHISFWRGSYTGNADKYFKTFSAWVKKRPWYNKVEELKLVESGNDTRYMEIIFYCMLVYDEFKNFMYESINYDDNKRKIKKEKISEAYLTRDYLDKHADECKAGFEANEKIRKELKDYDDNVVPKNSIHYGERDKVKGSKKMEFKPKEDIDIKSNLLSKKVSDLKNIKTQGDWKSNLNKAVMNLTPEAESTEPIIPVPTKTFGDTPDLPTKSEDGTNMIPIPGIGVAIKKGDTWTFGDTPKMSDISSPDTSKVTPSGAESDIVPQNISQDGGQCKTIDLPCTKKPLIKKFLMMIKNEQNNLHEGVPLNGIFNGKSVKLNTIFEGDERRFKAFSKANDGSIYQVNFGPAKNESCGMKHKSKFPKKEGVLDEASKKIATKQFKIGEYAVGGIIKVDISTDSQYKMEDFKIIKIQALDYNTKKPVNQEEIFGSNELNKVTEYLNELTSSYYADIITKWIKQAANIKDRDW